MANVLVNHPAYGSLWLSNCQIVDSPDGDKLVVGDMWDTTGVGDPRMPDDYRGEPLTTNFPVSCIRKDPQNLRGYSL